MRTSVLPAAALLLFAAPTKAQILAGEVPNGMSALDLNIELAPNAPFTTDSASLELDCDDFHDVVAVLFRGAPEIDAPNVAMLRMVDDDLEFCAELDASPRPEYYEFNEPLECPGGFDWQSSDELVLGDFGGFSATGPWTIDSMYIAYRRGAQVGWILLSFELTGNLGPNLHIHQVLPICPASTSVEAYEQSPVVALFPNPSCGEPVRVESSGGLQSIEVLDPSGRVIARYGGTVRTIAAPDAAGTYLVRATDLNGRRATTRLIRY